MLRFFSLILLFFSLTACSTFNTMIGIEEEIVDFPPGEYIGTAKLVKLGEDKPSDLIIEKVKLNFIPKEPGITDGVGVLTMNDESQRFYWRTEGNNTDTWNVLFTKDNNLYSSINNTFKFDGVVTSSETENKIEGRLYFDYDSSITQYFINASQFFKPKILPPKAAIAIKGGDSFDIQAEKVGEDQEELEAILSKGATEKEAAVTKTLEIKQMTSDKGVSTITLATEKGLSKGDYSLQIIRSKEYKSNGIIVTFN